MMVANKPATAEMVMRRLIAADPVVVDVETSGLDYRINHIIGWVLTFGPGPDDTFYIPVRHAGGGNLPSLAQVPTTAANWEGGLHPIEPEIIKGLKGKKLIFHNAPFDMRFMYRVGWVPTGPVMDTMVAAYLVDELRPSLSLESCCVTEKVQAKKGDQLYQAISKKFGCAPDKSSMALLWCMPGDDFDVVDYACGDGTSTWQLAEALLKSIARPYYTSSTREYNMQAVADVEFKLTPILHKMSMRGVKVDEEELDNLIKDIKTEYEESLGKIGEMNVKSPIQVKAYLEKHGVTNWPLTPGGAPSFAEKWMLTHDPGRAVIKVRKYRTLLDNFLLPMRGKFMYHGRIHTEFHQTRDEEFGTRTGRLSTTSPNMGAMPGKRQGNLGRRFRQFVIPDEGKEFTEADYNVCEIRICAHYCQAAAWIEGFKQGKDPHTAVADAIGIIRLFAKRINLALMTGAGKGKIALELELPIDEATRIIEQYFDGLPELRQFQRDSTRIFKNRGFVSTLLGRRLQLADPNKAYTALNRLTQGGNADIIKSAMVALDEHEDIDVMLTVYDSTLFQHEIGNTEAKMRAVRKLSDMGALGIPLSVPMRTEYGSGPTWGEASFSLEGYVE